MSQPQMEPWMLPGVFVICIDDGWHKRSEDGRAAPDNPPKRGRVYTLAGAIRFPGLIVFALAEFPHFAFPAANFRSVPHFEHMLFRRMLNPTTPILERELTINGRTH